ncbi:MAG: DUF4386 domain-containing protein [Bacteroidota bacterium]
MNNHTIDASRQFYARLAGFMFLFYIVTGITCMILFSHATGGDGITAKLTSIIENATTVRLTIVLDLLAFVDAVVLAVALYAITRDQDHDLAVMALCCRVSEGVIVAISTVTTLGLLSIAMATTGADARDTDAVHTIAAFLFKVDGWTTIISGTCFAVGSTIYSYLFLRARSIPVPLAWLGIIASILLVPALPLQLAGFIGGPVTTYIWIPILVFEMTLGLWLLIKGVAVQPAAT